MKRRKAIKAIGIGLPAGLALPTFSGLLNSCRPEDPGPEIKYDGVVAVIGAGAAGLYAADMLRSKGIRIKIFEASDRIGGRIRSVRLFDNSPVKTDFPIELGAERIIGTDSIWAEIIDRLKIPIVDLSTSITDNFIIDNSYKEGGVVSSDTDFTVAFNFSTNLKNYAGGNVSVQQAIQSAGINERVHRILNSWIGNRAGTSNERISASALAESLRLLTRDNNERMLRSNSMQDVLVSRFSAVVPEVNLNHIIKTIDYSPSKIKLSGEKVSETGNTENISEEVDKVIVTVPVSILKNGGISFTPPLPSTKISALARIGMDASIRLILDFKQNFWGTNTRFIMGGSQAPEYFNTGFSRSDFNKTLSITINGPRAEELSPLGPDMINHILQELDIVFAGKATQNIRRDSEDKVIFELHDWYKQPYIKGGISYNKPGGTNEDRILLAQSIENALFFAGEASDINGEFGTVNGALLSAERVSAEVIESILNS